MNSVNFIGRLTKEPELRSAGGYNVIDFTIAVQGLFKNKKTNEYEADFIDCKIWNKGAEYLNKYGRKGKRVAVSGSLKSETYTDNNNVVHYKKIVIVDTLSIVDFESANG